MGSGERLRMSRQQCPVMNRGPGLKAHPNVNYCNGEIDMADLVAGIRQANLQVNSPIRGDLGRSSAAVLQSSMARQWSYPQRRLPAV